MENIIPKKSMLIFLFVKIVSLIEDSNETEYDTFIDLLDAYELESGKVNKDV